MKKMYTLILLGILSVSGYAQFNTVDNPDDWEWIKHQGPVLENGDPGSWESNGVGFPSVLLLNEVYHMWYGGIRDDAVEIGHATSTDGINWIKDSQNPVLKKGEAGSWDAGRVYLPTVVHDGSIFHMWYIGANYGGIENSGYATSEDGINWTKEQSKPPFDVHAVIYDGELFHMWSHYNNDLEVMYATSENGSDWTISLDSPVMVGAEPGNWDYPRMQVSSAIVIDDTIHMCYSGGDFYTWSIGYATSPDGINWVKDTQNPVLERGEVGEWDHMYVAFGSLLYDESDHILKMWYYGGDTIYKGDIGYAEFDYTNAINNSTYDQGLSIYPNPAKNILNLQRSSFGEKVYSITSINGQLVQSGFLSGDEVEIDVSHLPKGMYFVTLRSNQRLMTTKFIKE